MKGPTKKPARRTTRPHRPEPPPSIKWGRAIGDICVAEEWESEGTLLVWVAGDRGNGTVSLMDQQRVELLRDSLNVWLKSKEGVRRYAARVKKGRQ